MSLGGLEVYPHLLATRPEIQTRVLRPRPASRNKYKKKIIKETVYVPCALRMGNKMYVHPSIYEKLKVNNVTPYTHRI
jgi:hypothetical protein